MYFWTGDNCFIVCGHCVRVVFGGKIFSEEQVFKTTDISRLQLSDRSRVSSPLCESEEKGQFICINTRYINHTKQKHKAVVLDLRSSNNIISICFLCPKLLLISVELNITQSQIRPLDSDSFVIYSLSTPLHNALPLAIMPLKMELFKLNCSCTAIVTGLSTKEWKFMIIKRN